MKLIVMLAILSLLLSAALVARFIHNEQVSSTLSIQVNGKEIHLPEGAGKLGLLAVDGRIITTPMVPPEERTLGKFFDAWGVRFTQNCLFQYCNEEMRMFVNGLPEFRFRDYVPKNGDQILISVDVH